MQLHDYHTHLESGPYDVEWVKVYHKTAMEHGLSEIGFSDHAYRFVQARNLLTTQWGNQHDFDLNQYVSCVEQAKALGLQVKLGIEMDYVPSKESGIRQFLNSVEWDYIIGSVHWIDDWGFDLAKFIHEWNERDVVDSYYSYYEILQMAIRSRMFDILGHFDVIKVFGYRPSPHINMMPVYESTIRLMKDYDIVFEINTAGLRKPVKELYPSLDIFGLVAKYELPIIISSDAHHPNNIAQDFEMARQLALSYGFRHVVKFTKRQRELIPLA
ncbi:histidinol-phosphatase [Chrysiogenes arsenatis]|uniref:histidinol-phosphatase n=1 Tax=Chrysiogenes arsenatis TaxID=309797 RepID=UPI000408D8FA|nr:histidinol-phosphatase [Chrysiogenes arsenatis]